MEEKEKKKLNSTSFILGRGSLPRIGGYIFFRLRWLTRESADLEGPVQKANMAPCFSIVVLLEISFQCKQGWVLDWFLAFRDYVTCWFSDMTDSINMLPPLRGGSRDCRQRCHDNQLFHKSKSQINSRTQGFFEPLHPQTLMGQIRVKQIWKYHEPFVMTEPSVGVDWNWKNCDFKWVMKPFGGGFGPSPMAFEIWLTHYLCMLEGSVFNSSYWIYVAWGMIAST